VICPEIMRKETFKKEETQKKVEVAPVPTP